MDIKLSTDTDHLRQLIESALDNTELGYGDTALFDAVTEEVLSTLVRQSVAQLGPRTLERNILAALDAARDGALLRHNIYTRATGGPSTVEGHSTVYKILGHLIGLGHVASGSGSRGKTGEWYFITEKGRQALRS